MNNEIKEILELNGDKYNVNLPKEVKEAFTCIDYELSVCSCELPKILDYITNLQEENERLKIEKQEEYNRFNLMSKFRDNALERTLIYKKRNEKAIDHIKQHQLIFENQYEELSGFDNHLLDILNGDDDNE